MRSITKLILLSTMWALAACQTESGDLGPGKIDYGTAKVESDGVKKDITAEVDILFVVDDSGSMRAHQATLAKNIDRFVDAFAKKSIVDFHIGVLSVYDSRRYGTYDIDMNKVLAQGKVPFKNRDGVQQYDQIGHLRPLKAPAGSETLLQSQKAGNFIQNGPGFVEILKESLKIGVRDYVANATDTVDASGPEYEESFSPVVAALRDPVLSGWNKGFLREKAHLVIVFVTDANDASVITASQLHRFLMNLKKGRDNFSVFGVVNPINQTLKCARDPSGHPGKVEDLINMANGRVLNMCANYANELAEIGRIVRDRTLRELRIPLSRLPVVDSIQVTYGSTVIPSHQTNGWTYDGETKSVVIRGAAEWTAEPGAKINVTFEPVDPSRRSSICIGCN